MRPGQAAVLGGALMGAGVAAMHCMGIASMPMQARAHHDHRYSTAAVAIALAGAHYRLLLALRLRGPAATPGARR